MKILLIPPNDLLRHPIPNRMYHIAMRLTGRHDVILLSYTGHPLAGEVKRTLRAVEVPIHKAIRAGNLGLYYTLNTPQIYITLKNIIEREGMDIIIHANILPSFIATVLAKKYGISNIYDFLDYFPESASAYYTRGKHLIELGVKAFIYPALKNSNAVITPSFGLRSILRSVVPEKPIYVIPNGVDPDLFKPINRDFARKNIGLDDDRYLLLLQGSLDVWVDVESLLKILRKLRRTIDVGLLVVGFSHAKHYYRLLSVYAKRYEMDKYIYTYPPQPYEMMPLFINASDIVVAPIKKMIKNFATPLKIAEALACGVPVITTDIPEFKLWYKQGVYFYSDYEELAQVLFHVVNNEDIKKELIEHSDYFRKEFSWDNISNRFENIVEATINKNKHSME
jgi:glycosyltransferase involved in cell wall biosynthesis